MNYRRISTRIFTSFVPQVRFIQLIYNKTRNKTNYQKLFNMKLSVKVLIGSGITLFVIIVFGFIGFPKFLKHQIKSQITLKPSNDIRNMYVKVPFPLDFKIYIFNVTNYLEVSKGDSPVLDEVGPFVYEEWKEKVDTIDNEANDTFTFKMKDTFIFNKEKSYPLTGDELVTIPHPLMVIIALAVELKSPGLLSLVNGALKALFNPEHPFLTASVNDIFFNGIVINCTTDDFKAQTLCTKLKTEGEGLEIISDTIFKFSLFGAKNGTAGKPYTVLRGTKNFHDVGKVVVYNGKDNIDLWPTKECNKFEGTDGTIFPPFLSKEEGVISFSPELCRSFAANFHSDTVYDGIPVRKYTADFGDMSTDPALKCYCYTNTTCLKRGTMDLTKCADAPLIVSFPHFYLADQSYLNAVRGLRPNEAEHGIVILFESMTGGPVYAKKRLQFNFPLKPIKKVAFMKTLPEVLLPVFWVEEGVALNNTFTKPIKTLFTMMKVVKVMKWIIAVIAIIGLAIGGFLHFKPNNGVKITALNNGNGNNTINEPQKNVISMINSNLDNRERTNGINDMQRKQFDKY